MASDGADSSDTDGDDLSQLATTTERTGREMGSEISSVAKTAADDDSAADDGAEGPEAHTNGHHTGSTPATEVDD